nr:hypothetical protein [Candidatus Sigynarchaeota archaeon]
MELKIEQVKDKQVKDLVKNFTDKVNLLDAPGARRCILEIITLIRTTSDEMVKRDASIVLETIQQIDYSHPEDVLIFASSWKGDMDQIKKNIANDMKVKNYDQVADMVPKLIYLVETNKDLYIRVKSAEILAEIAGKYQHPLLLDKFQPRFFKLMFDDSLDVTQYIAEILYNIDFHTFDTHSPEKIRKILTERFEENLVNTWVDVVYFRHLIKLEINIENFTRNWIWNVVLKVKNDPGFSIVKVEPECPAKADLTENAQSIELNVIQHRSAKKIIVYLEPKFQPSIQLQIKVSYKNNDGKTIVKELENDAVDLFQLVPQFLTTVNFGQAHSKEFFEFRAKVKESRKLVIPDNLKPELLTNAVKNLMQSESILSVYEYKTEQFKDDSEYYSEIYFHGQTKIGQDEVVLVSRISGEDRTFALMIAANKPPILTGLYNKVLSKLFSQLGLKPFVILECPKCLEPLEKGMVFCPSCKYTLK